MVYPKILIIILVLVFFLRLPSLFEPFWYGDEGIYLVMGEALRRGWVWYRDIHDNKPPLLYLVAGLAGNVFWFRAILLVWMLFTVWLFFHLTKKIFSQNKKAAHLSTFLFAFLTSIPLLEGNIANAEIFMIGPIIAAILLFLALLDKKQRPLHFVKIGLLFSLAALFKVPAAFDFLAVIVFLLLFVPERLFAIRHTLYAIVGFLLPLLATVVYYWSQGAASFYLQAAFFQNIGYLSSWGAGQQGAPLWQSGLLQRGAILALFLGLLYWKRKRFKKETLFLFIWFLFSLFAALLSERPYPHYLIQILPSFSLIFSFLFLGQPVERILAAFSVFFLLFSILYFHFYFYSSFSYYQNFLSWIGGFRTRQAYFAAFDPRTPQTYQVADYLTTHTEKEEPVFIWGNEPHILALSRRLPPGRYIVSYHILDFEGFEETMRVLKQKKPPLIIKMKKERKFRALEQFLASDYLKIETIQEAEIYHRLR